MLSRKRSQSQQKELLVVQKDEHCGGLNFARKLEEKKKVEVYERVLMCWRGQPPDRKNLLRRPNDVEGSDHREQQVVNPR